MAVRLSAGCSVIILKNIYIFLKKAQEKERVKEWEEMVLVSRLDHPARTALDPSFNQKLKGGIDRCCAQAADAPFARLWLPLLCA